MSRANTHLRLDSDGEAKQVSFVNSIATTRGGTHITHVATKIINVLQPIVKKKNKGAEVKPFQIRNHLWIFVNTLINNPEFDSQTKETLKSKQTAFGSKCELSEAFFKKRKFLGTHSFRRDSNFLVQLSRVLLSNRF
jgi:DNA topoisomerase-2